VRIALADKNPPYVVGGSERTNASLGRLLESAGHEVTFVNRDTVRMKRQGRIEILDTARVMIRIGAEVERRKHEFDVVITSGVTGWRVRFQPAIQIYHGTFHGMRAHIGLWPPTAYIAAVVYCWIEKGAGRGKTVVAVSTSTKEEVESQYGQPVARVIPIGIDTDHFSPGSDKAALRAKLGLPQDRFLIGFVGRISPQKGIDVLVAMAQMLPPSMAVAAAIPAAADLGDRIIQRPRVPYEDMPDFYSACDCYVLPSRNEGCSQSLIEAMACGLPFVVSRVGHVPDICAEDEVLARGAIDGLDPNEYADRVRMLADDAALREESGRRAREYALRHNSLPAFGRAYLDLIAEVTGS
jgi:glycosyltransferase involved in cell wall biosynthesis